jgi:hypothetical protein
VTVDKNNLMDFQLMLLTRAIAAETANQDYQDVKEPRASEDFPVHRVSRVLLALL